MIQNIRRSLTDLLGAEYTAAVLRPRAPPPAATPPGEGAPGAGHGRGF